MYFFKLGYFYYFIYLELIIFYIKRITFVKIYYFLKLFKIYHFLYILNKKKFEGFSLSLILSKLKLIELMFHFQIDSVFNSFQYVILFWNMILDISSVRIKFYFDVTRRKVKIDFRWFLTILLCLNYYFLKITKKHYRISLSLLFVSTLVFRFNVEIKS